MHFSTQLYTALGLIASASASPLIKKADTNVTDGDVLNYALTLEQLEAAFYSGALEQFSEEDFESAGYPGWVRNRIEQISAHEDSHVEFIAGALEAAGITPTEPCTYEFNVTDPETFIAAASLLEAVGTSAYLGAAQYVANKDYLTASASILAIEARHAAWIGSAAEMENPWATAFETPLTFNQVYTIASAFITSCPDSNPSLPVMAYPMLTVTPAESGEESTFEFDMPEGDDSTLYAAILIGLDTQYVELTQNNGMHTAMLPDQICGPSYIQVTKTNTNSTADENIVAGPIVTRLACDSDVDAMSAA